jgi:hypothetical protein
MGSSVSTVYSFVQTGEVLGPTSIGLPASPNNGVSDPSAIELPNGDIRVYYGTFGLAQNGIGSATSTNGIDFTVDSGLRVVGGASPIVYPLPGGGYRMYYIGPSGVVSATSTDGLAFTADPGIRLASDVFGPVVGGSGANSLGCSAIVSLASGGYRMYCFQSVAASSEYSQGVRAIFSATSPDLLKWTPDPGVRIGPGSPSLTNDAQHPTAIVNADGSVSLIFDSALLNGSQDEWIATSQDGLSFNSETDTGLAGAEPSVVSLSNGSLLLYIGEDSPTTLLSAGTNKEAQIWLATGSVSSTTTTTTLTTTTTVPPTTTTTVPPTTTTTLKALTPRAPSIHVSSISKGVLTISLKGAVANGGSPITGFQYSLGDKSWINVSKNSHGVFVISHLKSGRTYSVRLRAQNALGSGEPSNALNVRVR